MPPSSPSPRPLRAWQAEALPCVLSSLAAQRAGSGAPGVVAACTGSGKSILIAEVIRRVLPRIQPGQGIVVTTPTVALVEQLRGTISAHCGIEVGTAYTRGWSIDQPVVVACHPSAPDLIAEYRREAVLWIADEAHRESPAILEFSAALPKACARLGFSATPFRGGKDPRLALWAEEVYAYPAERALRDGVLVPFEVRYAAEIEGDNAVDRLSAIVDLARGVEGPGVVSARTIAEAEEVADQLCAAGIPAAAISSAQTSAEQAALLARLFSGALRALAYPTLLSEGVDLPWLRWIGLYAPRSRQRLIQELGRVLRTAPGKGTAVVLDPGRQIEKHGITPDAALGWGVVDPATLAREQREEEEGEILALPPRLLRQLLASPESPWAAWALSLRQSALAQGLEVRPLRAGAWRTSPASAETLAYLEVCRARLGRLSAPHRRAAYAALSGLLTEGAASDLAQVLRALKGSTAILKPSFEAPSREFCERVEAANKGCSVGLGWSDRSVYDRYFGRSMQTAIMFREGQVFRAFYGENALMAAIDVAHREGYRVFVAEKPHYPHGLQHEVHEAARAADREANALLSRKLRRNERKSA